MIDAGYTFEVRRRGSLQLEYTLNAPRDPQRRRTALDALRKRVPKDFAVFEIQCKAGRR